MYWTINHRLYNSATVIVNNNGRTFDGREDISVALLSHWPSSLILYCYEQSVDVTKLSVMLFLRQ